MKLGRMCMLTFIVIVGSACASNVNKTMDSWVGVHQSKLIASWGPPQRVASDGNGGQVLIYGSYVNLGQNPGSASIDSFGDIEYTAPTQRGYARTRMFYVSPDGYIYNWRWQGL